MTGAAFRAGVDDASGRELDRSRDPGRARPLAERGDAPPPLVFRRGARAPYATRWFGVTSLAGHARNLVATAIAAESVDSRDWMQPSSAGDLLANVARLLGADASRPAAAGQTAPPATLVEAMGRAVWVDFVADTGDDRDVSHAVAQMLFSTYRVDGGAAPRVLPRGDLLIFGGDTAYPVATGEEIARRVVAPFNEVLREEADGRARVLLGVPGNHDWYDGLDGFARLFRRGPRESAQPDATPGATRRRRRRRGGGLVARQLHLDEIGGVLRLVGAGWRSIRALWSGTKVARPRRLVLLGYEAVQEASYWALPLAPDLEAWGVDRQLGRLDYRQRLFFAERRRAEPRSRVLFIAPDPAIAFGERHEPGARMLSGCRLSLDRDRVFYLTGDVHHYERRRPSDGSLHVIAGGGGAFLHGTRMTAAPAGAPDRVWPSAATSRSLVAQVPLKLMAGSAGFILHLAFALVGAAELAAAGRSPSALAAVACVASALLWVALYTTVGHGRPHARVIAALGAPFGAALGLLPLGLRLALPRVVPALEGDIGALLVYAFVGPLVLGVFLAAMAALGLEHQQAFCVLSHPGFKHFVRMCVHPDGRV